LKEKGKWTPEDEAANQKAVKAEEQRMADWKSK
jgi:hypothetical protein